MSDDGIKILINRLEAFKKELLHKISFSQGQLEMTEDMVKQLKELDSGCKEKKVTQDTSLKVDNTKNLRGVKTPTRRSK